MSSPNRSIWPRWTAGRSLGQLDQYLSAIHDRLEHGPIPGALITLQFHVQGAVPASTNNLQKIPIVGLGNLRLIYASGIVAAAGTSANVMVKHFKASGGSDSLFTANLNCGSTGAVYNQASAFAVRELRDCGFLRLDTGTLTGAPTNLDVTLIFKGVSRVDQA